MKPVRWASGEWRVTSGVWRVTSDEWRVACGVWRVTSGVWRVTSGEEGSSASPVTRHPSPVTRHPSPVTRHPSPVTRHPLNVLIFSFSVAVVVALATPPARADMLVGSGGNVLIPPVPSRVLRFDDWGVYLGDFVTAGSGGLDTPRGMAFGPDGNFYVASFNTDQVLRYDGVTGAFIDVFVTAGSGGLDDPEELIFKDGFLYVSGFRSHNVLRYHASTGGFDSVFASADVTDFLDDMVFGPDGNLYVSSPGGVSGGNLRILRFNGTTGAFVDVFASGFPNNGPRGLAFGPDGNLYVGTGLGNSVQRYDPVTKMLLGDFVSPGSGGLTFAEDVEFGPDGSLYVVSRSPGPVPPPQPGVLRYDGTTGAFLGVAAFGNGLAHPTFVAFAIPEPATVMLLGIGLLSLVVVCRRRR